MSNVVEDEVWERSDHPNRVGILNTKLEQFYEMVKTSPTDRDTNLHELAISFSTSFCRLHVDGSELQADVVYITQVLGEQRSHLAYGHHPRYRGRTAETISPDQFSMFVDSAAKMSNAPWIYTISVHRI